MAVLRRAQHHANLQTEAGDDRGGRPYKRRTISILLQQQQRSVAITTDMDAPDSVARLASGSSTVWKVPDLSHSASHQCLTSTA